MAGVLLWSVAWCAGLFGRDAVAQSMFGPERYEQLLGEVESTVAAWELVPEGPAARGAAEEALRANLDLFHYLNAWVESGTMPEGWRARAAENRLDLMGNVLDLAATLERCDVLERLGELIEFWRVIEEDGVRSVRAEALAHLRECRQANWSERRRDLFLGYGASSLARLAHPPHTEAFRRSVEQVRARAGVLLEHLEAGLEQGLAGEPDRVRRQRLALQVDGMLYLVELGRCDEARAMRLALAPRVDGVVDDGALAEAFADHASREAQCGVWRELRDIERELEVLEETARAVGEGEGRDELHGREIVWRRRAIALVADLRAGWPEESGGGESAVEADVGERRFGEREALRASLDAAWRRHHQAAASAWLAFDGCDEAEAHLLAGGGAHPLREPGPWQLEQENRRRFGESCERARRPAWPLVVAGVGVAAIGAAVVVDARASSARDRHDRLQERCRTFGCDAAALAERDAEADRVRRSRPLVAGLGGGGVVLAGGGLGLYFGRAPRRERIHPEVRPLPSGGDLASTGAVPWLRLAVEEQ